MSNEDVVKAVRSAILDEFRNQEGYDHEVGSGYVGLTHGDEITTAETVLDGYFCLWRVAEAATKAAVR